jgi:hypothetical protein
MECEFNPCEGSVEVRAEDGTTVEADFDDLKAVFFIKDPRRRNVELQISSMDVFKPAPGAEARVEFFDGEVIHGRVIQYSVEDHGFFLFPTSPESNNERIFVVVQALKTLFVETLTEGDS